MDESELPIEWRRMLMLRAAAGIARALHGDRWYHIELMLFDREDAPEDRPSTSYTVPPGTAALLCRNGVDGLAGAARVVHPDVRKIVLAVFVTGRRSVTTIQVMEAEGQDVGPSC